MQMIGREGKKEAGELSFPKGIAVDSKQRLIMGDKVDEPCHF